MYFQPSYIYKYKGEKGVHTIFIYFMYIFKLFLIQI